MNTPIEPNSQDTLPQIDEQRRRLAKGGLAAPIVLGTLLSRPVLGAAPYNCTVSGKLSGNTSSHGAPVICYTLGKSPGYWGNQAGTHPWTPLNKNALFNAVFADAYPGMTLLQVIQSGGGMTPTDNYPALGRAAVASWLNAYHMTNFPLTQPQVIAMFNAVYGGGSYQVNGTTFWDADDVMAYFQGLYQPPSA